MKCKNCFEDGVYTALVDRETHYFCARCGRRQEKSVKRVSFAVDPWDTEVKY